MGDGLHQQLEIVFDITLTNILAILSSFGILVGIGMTAPDSPSSGVTVLTVGLASAGTIDPASGYWDCYGSQYWNNRHFIIGFKLGDYSFYRCSRALILLHKNKPSITSTNPLWCWWYLLCPSILWVRHGNPLRDFKSLKTTWWKLSKNPILSVLVGTGLTLLIQAPQRPSDSTKSLR